jgi:hypothetical protein
VAAQDHARGEAMAFRWVFLSAAAGTVLLLAAAATSASAQLYHRGQACWEETPCPSFYTQPGQMAAAARSKALPLRRTCRAVATAGQRAGRPSPIRAAPAPSEPRFYRYPTMYRAEAPPLLPPGARAFAPFVQQPYVLVFGGIWYWPGAREFKMPQVTGFEPVIDPSRVISW